MMFEQVCMKIRKQGIRIMLSNNTVCFKRGFDLHMPQLFACDSLVNSKADIELTSIAGRSTTGILCRDSVITLDDCIICVCLHH